MNAESITGWLAAVGVPAEVVSIGAEADNAWCLLREEQPTEGGPAWEVFWREQGNRYDWARFSNEQVACHYLFGRLTWAQVARGAVGLLAGAQADPRQTGSGDRPPAARTASTDAAIDAAADTANDETPPTGTATDRTPPTGTPRPALS